MAHAWPGLHPGVALLWEPSLCTGRGAFRRSENPVTDDVPREEDGHHLPLGGTGLTESERPGQVQGPAARTQGQATVPERVQHPSQ